MGESDQAHANMRKFLGEAVTELLSWPHVDRVVANMDGPNGRIAVYLDDDRKLGAVFDATEVEQIVSTKLLLTVLRNVYDQEGATPAMEPGKPKKPELT